MEQQLLRNNSDTTEASLIDSTEIGAISIEYFMGDEMGYHIAVTAEEPSYPNIPERHLLAAILERAYRDALSSTIETHLIREAIAWFLTPTTYPLELGFTFEQVAEELKLTARRMSFLMDNVKEASINHDALAITRQKDVVFRNRPWTYWSVCHYIR